MKVISLFLSLVLIGFTIAAQLRIHVISHTHDDVGWLQTMDDYFYKVKCVKCILDNMLVSLSADKRRTFTYVEMAFFKKWYDELREDKKLEVKELVKTGRLEFANGGWVMNDEADAWYQHIIDQMRLGLDFLKREFDVQPKIAWSIDPFGHSSINAKIMAKLGFDTLVVARIDYKEKELRKKERTLEFIWYPTYSQDLTQTKIFTYISHDHYNVNYKKMFDRFLDEEDLELKNKPKKVENLAAQTLKYFQEVRSWYRSDNIFFFYGDDFTFQKANISNINLEAIMDYVNNNPEYNTKITFEYSTPSRYFNAIKNEGIRWPEYKNFDFFPYADKEKCYWTGYFTTRPYLKGLIRDAGKYLSVASKLMANLLIKNSDPDDFEKNFKLINNMRENLAVAQHHDGVSGTATEKVSQDYIDRLRSSIKVVKEVISNLTKSKEEAVEVCLDASTERKCMDKVYTISKEKVIKLVNQGLEGKFPVALKVNKNSVHVFQNGAKLNANLICEKPDQCTIFFFVEFKHTVQFEVITLKESAEPDKGVITSKKIGSSSYNIFSNENVTITFNKETGFRYLVKKGQRKYKFKLVHSAFVYAGTSNIRDTDPENGNNLGGAYIMSPETTDTTDYNITDCEIYEGDVITEIRITYDHSNLKLRVYKQQDFQYFIEAVSESDSVRKNKRGEELFLRVKSDIKNNEKIENSSLPQFYTDSNGLLMMRRIKDYRFGWKYSKDEEVSSNFYPVNYAMSIEDTSDHRTITVFTDRSQTGGAMNTGDILLDFNRSTKSYDYRGLNEAPCEKQSCTVKFKVKHWIAVTKSFNDAKMNKLINKRPILLEEIPNSEVAIKTNLSLEEELFEIKDKVNCNLEYNFYIRSKSEFLLEFINKSDKYFKNDKIDCIVGIVNNPKFRILETNLSGLTIYNDVKSLFVESNTLSLSPSVNNSSVTNYRLKAQEFKTFLVKIK